MLSEKNRRFRKNCDKRTTTNTSGPAFLSSAACIPHLKIIISFCLSYVKLILEYNLSYDKLYSILYPYKTAAPIFSRGSGFVAKRKPLAELVERKSLRLWTKIKLLVKVKLGLPTNKTRNKEDLIVDKDISSLEHTRWRCQYHVVFSPKYRRLAIYGELKQDIGYILRKLCERKGIEIIEAEACPDHIHMLISIPPKLSVSQVMGYLKGKSSLMIFDRHANLKYKYGNRHFWARGYYVDTVRRNKKAIQEYIQNQLKEDELADQLSIKEYFDPFTGEKVDQGRKGQKGSFTSSKRK